MSMDAQLEVTNVFNMTCFFRSIGYRKGGIAILRDDNVASNACSLQLAVWGLQWRAYVSGQRSSEEVFSFDDARVGGNGEVKLFTHVQGQQHCTYHLSIHLRS
jgi:hypothetical protein